MVTYSSKRSWLPDIGSTHPDMLDSATLSATAPLSRKRPKTTTETSRVSNIISKHTTQFKKTRLMQTTIDLGEGARKICRKCGMQFVLSSIQDAKAHTKYCASVDEVLTGTKVSRKDFEDCRMIESSRPCKINKPVQHYQIRLNDRGPHSPDYIVEVTRRSNARVRTFAEKILRAVERELGSVKITADTLWGMIDDPVPSSKTQKETNKHDAFKVYMYVANGRCVGLCLAQRIWKARTVTGSCLDGITAVDGVNHQEANDTNGTNTGSSSYCADGVTVDTVILGISRIWVAPNARNSGVAVGLLDVVQRFFLTGRILYKSEIAFSQPTESGLRLARKWHRADSGWCVYDERDEDS